MSQSSPALRSFYSYMDVILDPTILLSFDRYGFCRHAVNFEPADLSGSMRGKVCLITGANSGIGLATAHALARAGAEVHLLCRRVDAGQAAQAEVRERSGNDQVFAWQLDVSSLASVRDFAQRFDRPQVDVLVQNAGVLPNERQHSAEKVEMTFATNLLGPFLLTRLLEPRLKQAPAARVIWVSSGGMYPQKLNLSALLCPPEPFDGVRTYANTKRAMVVLSELLAEHWKGSSVVSLCMHPGWADTPAVRTSIPTFWNITRSILRSSEQGADTVIWLAMKPGLENASGKFFFDRKPRRTHFVPWTRESAAQRLAFWTLLESNTLGVQERTRISQPLSALQMQPLGA
ncbi:MAG: SDR family NAD(P)-dependent oxidoreductase [Myxococcota bacterium]